MSPKPQVDPKTEPIHIVCGCGAFVPVVQPAIRCRCGREIGRFDGPVAVFNGRTPYWGEIPEDKMHALLEASAREGWREAARRLLPPDLFYYIADPRRAAFQSVFPVPPGGRVLDIGAGLGAIATELARRYRVLALEGVRERTQMLEIRKAQDNLDNLTIWNADLNSVRLKPGQFDGIVVNGVLEWVALFDPSLGPDDVQVRFLKQLRELLTPGGKIYVAIESRFGWNQIRGAIDHSGLRYTSLLPRFLARMACRYSSNYRSDINAGYRTYTYSYYGYRKLFRRAGLKIVETYVSLPGYNEPTDLIPLRTPAIREYVKRAEARHTVRRKVRGAFKEILGWESVWRIFAGDFIFLLEADSV